MNAVFLVPKVPEVTEDQQEFTVPLEFQDQWELAPQDIQVQLVQLVYKAQKDLLVLEEHSQIMDNFGLMVTLQITRVRQHLNGHIQHMLMVYLLLELIKLELLYQLEVYIILTIEYKDGIQQ